MCKKHPLTNPESKHYQMIDGVEAIERMEQMYSRGDLMAWAKLSAMKYRLRICNKDNIIKDATKIEGFEAYYNYLKHIPPDGIVETDVESEEFYETFATREATLSFLEEILFAKGKLQEEGNCGTCETYINPKNLQEIRINLPSELRTHIRPEGVVHSYKGIVLHTAKTVAYNYYYVVFTAN